MILTERDKLIILTIARFRLMQGRQIKNLCGFDGQRATDRRLKLLIDNGYLIRQRIIYGVAGLYSITEKSKKELDIRMSIAKVRLDQITHDITVVDTAMYVIATEKIFLSDIETEKELRHKQGFSARGHEPDFIYKKDGKTICVEVELSLKAKARLEKNLKDNYLKYDLQRWVISKHKPAISDIVTGVSEQYPNIEIATLEDIEIFVKGERNAE